MSRKAETVGTVRERERESYTLVKESVVLFDSLTHTSRLLENKKKKVNKENIIRIDKKDSDET